MTFKNVFPNLPYPDLRIGRSRDASLIGRSRDASLIQSTT